MPQFKYVIVATDGTSHDLSREETFDGGTFDLPKLLREGWRPGRETCMGEGQWWCPDDGETMTFGYVLLVLVKDDGPPGGPSPL
jgi:hypothetical protein